MGQYTLKEPTITKAMKEQAKAIVKSWREDYKFNKMKVGKPTTKFEIESYRVIGKMGGIKVNPEQEPDKYECVLTVVFPVYGFGFDTNDVHTYRWNEAKQEFEFEGTEAY